MVQTKTDTLKLYVVEEQELYRELYRHVLPARENIELLQVSSTNDIEAIRQNVSELHPDVLLLSVKKLNGAIVGELEQMRNIYPEMGRSSIRYLSLINPVETQKF